MGESECFDHTVFAVSICAEEIKFVQNQGLEVDIDNEPAPENAPVSNQAQSYNHLNEGQSWGFDCIV